MWVWLFEQQGGQQKQIFPAKNIILTLQQQSEKSKLQLLKNVLKEQTKMTTILSVTNFLNPQVGC